MIALTALLSELLSDAKQLTGALIALLSATYIGGFIIVNTHLSYYGIAHLQLLEPSYVASGLLYVSIQLMVAFMVLPLLALVSGLLNLANTCFTPDGRQKIETLRVTTKVFGREIFGSERLRVISRADFLICLALTVAVGGIFAVGWISGFLISIPLYLASGDVDDQLLNRFQQNLSPLTQLYSMALLATFLLIDFKDKIGRSFSLLIGSLSITIFLFVQTYSVLLIAKPNGLYSNLPVAIGGGKPFVIELLVDCYGADVLLKADLPIKDPVPITCPTADLAPRSLYRTEKLLLIWENNYGNSRTLVVTADCVYPIRCYAVEINTELFKSIRYFID